MQGETEAGDCPISGRARANGGCEQMMGDARKAQAMAKARAGASKGRARAWRCAQRRTTADSMQGETVAGDCPMVCRARTGEDAVVAYAWARAMLGA